MHTMKQAVRFLLNDRIRHGDADSSSRAQALLDAIGGEPASGTSESIPNGQQVNAGQLAPESIPESTHNKE